MYTTYKTTNNNGKTMQQIEITRSNGTTFTKSFDKKSWKRLSDLRYLQACDFKSARIIEVKAQKKAKKAKNSSQVFRFSNGMTLKYSGKRTNVTGAYIAVFQGEIVYKGFSSQGKEGARKASTTSFGNGWTMTHEQAKAGHKVKFYVAGK